MSKIITEENKIKEVLEKAVENIYPNSKELEKVLKSGKKIRLYTGYDPTAPSLHIGHAVTLRKLAQFQKLGHEVIMLIGDFTGMIGDPDKASVRQELTRAEVNKNLKNYKKQASKILNFSGKNAAKIRFNSKWNDKLTFIELVRLASNFTVQQMMAREMFQQRLAKKKPIYLHEFLYPLVQAYDSVVMDVDLEIGGNDQTFNMLRGRDLMRTIKGKEKFVLSTKLLADSSGYKMGKTAGNAVSLDDKSEDTYGKIMSWPDSLIFLGFELCTGISLKEIEKIKKQKNNPRDDKARLSKEITAIHFGKAKAEKAAKEFNQIFRQKKAPSDIKSYKLSAKKLNILDLIFKTKLASSKSEARRLVQQGAVKIDDEVIKDWQKEISLKSGMIIQVGKKNFIKLNI